MAVAKQRGLGTSFSTLIPKGLDIAALDDADRIQKLPLEKIVPNPDQPRQHFDTEALEELAESIKQFGIVQPLVVSPEGKQYRIIAGERRWRAAKIAGLKQAPAIVRTSKELEQLEIAIIENVQRVDLSPLETAVSIERLHQQFSLSYEAIAKRLGKANSTVVNTVRLLQLPEEAKEALLQKRITEGHARQLLALKNMPEKQLELLHLIINFGWSVRQAERYVTSHKEGVADAEKAQARVETETPQTKALGQRLGTKVHVKRMAHGGRLEITFKDDAHLAKLLEYLDNNVQ